MQVLIGLRLFWKTINTKFFWILLLLVGIIFGINLNSISTYAASFTTNTVLDTVDINLGDGICADSNGQCSIRAGIQEANSSASADTIIITTGNYSIDNSSPLVYTSSSELTILGSGVNNSMINIFETSYATNPVFDFNNSGKVTIRGLSIQGSNQNTHCTEALKFQNQSQPVILDQIKIKACRDSILNVNSTGDISITNSEVNGYDDGSSTYGIGLINVSGNITITDTAVYDMTNYGIRIDKNYISTDTEAVLLRNIQTQSNSLDGQGIIIYSSKNLIAENITTTEENIGINIINSIGELNNIITTGGNYGLVMNDTTVNGDNIVSTNNQTGAYIVNNSNNIVRIANSKFNNNISNSNRFGGGIYFQESCVLLQQSLYLSDVEINGNTASNGGGIYNVCGHLVLDRVTVSNNSADTGGGLYSTYPSVDPGTQADTNAYVDIKNSTFSGNGAYGDQAFGGAIYQHSERPVAATVPYTLDVLNTTFANNGSGIAVTGYTIEVNQNPINIRIRNSLFANLPFQDESHGGNCQLLDSTTTYTGNNNLSTDTTCSTATGFITDTTIPTYLGTLQNNGGTTKTHTLLAGSPAINTAPNTDCPSINQRLQARPITSTCDIGSYEYVPPVSIQNGTFKGIIFIDTNNNQTQDNSESALGGVSVEILDSNNQVVTTLITNNNGEFSGALPVGDYTYRVIKSTLPESLSIENISIGSGNGQFTIIANQEISIQKLGFFPTINITNAATIPTLLIRTGGTQ
jgi:large repetitive protein